MRGRPVGGDGAEKRILILSDDGHVARAIAASLKHCRPPRLLRIEARSPSRQRSRPERDDFDLVVVAANLPNSEPVVLLARAALMERVGLVPVLIVSDRPFEADPEARIGHLEFPFAAEALHASIQELLHDPQPARLLA